MAKRKHSLESFKKIGDKIIQVTNFDGSYTEEYVVHSNLRIYYSWLDVPYDIYTKKYLVMFSVRHEETPCAVLRTPNGYTSLHRKR